MAEKISYLSKLKFDQNLLKGWVFKFLNNPRLLFLIIVAIIAIGSVSFNNLPRRLNPEVKIPLVIVSTVLPGANPQDIESLVTIPIEDQIESVSNIKTVTSQSRDSVSVVTVEFESNIDPEKAKADVQSAIESVDLPEDSLDPNVMDLDFENQPVLMVTLIGSEDKVGLVRISDHLKKRLEEDPKIKEVVVSGIDEQEVQIVVDPTTSSTFGVSQLQLIQIIKSSLSSYPAGIVNTEFLTYSLTIDPEITSIDDIRNLVVSIRGSQVTLSDIAQVSLKSKPGQNPSFFASNTETAQESVSMSVYKNTNSNISDASHIAEEIISEELKNYEGIFMVKTVMDTAEEIEEQFIELYRDFAIIIVLVFVALFIFLGARQAIIASLSVPMTFLISFIIMGFTGMTLNFLTLFSLLLSLGLLVDDTIVVISAMTAYHRTGRFTPVQTGLLVWRDFITPIFTTTLTTVWAFVPLLLSTGIIGEFIVPIPIVVSGTLLASFFVAMFVNLPLVVIILKPSIPYRVALFVKLLFSLLIVGVLTMLMPEGPTRILGFISGFIFIFMLLITLNPLKLEARGFIKNNKKAKGLFKNMPRYIDNGIIHFDVIADRYRSLIYRILVSNRARKTTIVMVVIFSIFSYLLVPLGFVKNEFFPRSDSALVYVSVELPAGTNIQTTTNHAVSLLNEIRSTEGLDFATANIAQGYDATQGLSSSESNSFLIILNLVAENKRDISSIEITERLREDLADYQPGKISVFEQSGGPPAGSDIQIQVRGEDLAQLSKYADELINYLENTQGTTNIDKSIKEGTGKVVFSPDSSQVAQTGITTDQIGAYLRLFATGIPVDTVTFIDENTDTDLTIRMSGSTQDIESIGKLSIPTQAGSQVPINQLGQLKIDSNPTLITREDGQRTVSVTASVLPGFNNTDINRGLEEFAESELDIQSGYSWKTGGVNEENQNSVNSILQAMLLSFLLIVVTMVLQFSSFRKAIIVMLVIPLSISGVFIIFALTKTPLSFPALIGVLALFGIVVKNAILVVDKISANEKEGLPFVEGIVDAASSRLEAIALTSITAILGLIPITLSDPLWRGLGGAIIAGLTFSGTIMLFFIPVVYYYWFKPKKKNS